MQGQTYLYQNYVSLATTSIDVAQRHWQLWQPPLRLLRVLSWRILDLDIQRGRHLLLRYTTSRNLRGKTDKRHARKIIVNIWILWVAQDRQSMNVNSERIVWISMIVHVLKVTKKKDEELDEEAYQNQLIYGLEGSSRETHIMTESSVNLIVWRNSPLRMYSTQL